MQNSAKNLADIAPDFLPSEDEEKILRGAGEGHEVRFDDGATIRADFLKILILGMREDWPVSAAGVQFAGSGVVIRGALDLRHARAKGGDALPPLQILSCRLPDGIDLSDAKISRLTLDHCTDLSLIAERTEVGGDFSLRGAKCQHFQLDGARINGGFRAEDVQFESDERKTISLNGAHIEGDLLIDRLHSRNCGFDLSNSQIGGNVSADKINLQYRGRVALSLNAVKIGGGLMMRTPEVTGRLDFTELQTGASVRLLIGNFNAVVGPALVLDMAKINGALDVYYMTFNGNVSCIGLTLDGPFKANGAEFFRDEEGDKFLNPDGTALNLENAVMGGVHFVGAQFRGGIRAAAAKFSYCMMSGASLEGGPNGVALDMTNVHVEHDIDLNAGLLGQTAVEAATINGAIIFQNARIGGRLRLDGVTFESKPEHADCLSLRHARIDGSLEIRRLKGARNGRFDLSGAEIGAIDDDPDTGWPDPGLLDLDGLSYRTLNVADRSGVGKELALRRLAWLKRQYAGGRPEYGAFRPQPFEHLARIFRGHGHDYAATIVSIEKRELQRKYADRGFARLMHTILKITSDYGYSPARALAWFAAWVLAGAGFVRHGLATGLYESEGGGFERFHIEPFVYAFDLATPIIDFGQASAYRLKPACAEIAFFTLCNWREVLEVSYSALGFVLFSILVLTFSGVLRREGD